jgi:D-glycero-alpha-D-manno-heptose-7-phosphate kinase
LGGGSDVESYIREYGTVVLGTTINKYIYISLRYLPPIFDYQSRIVYSIIEEVKSNADIRHPAVKATLKELKYNHLPLSIHYEGDLPKGTGIGSSSSFLVGLINALGALDHIRFSPEELSQHSINIERKILKLEGGKQDQVFAAYGGLNAIYFHKDGKIEVKRISLSNSFRKTFENSFLLFYIGGDRLSGEMVASYHTNLVDRQHHLKEIAIAGIEALEQQNLDTFAKLLNEGWDTKKSCGDKISNQKLEDIRTAAMNSGAMAFKVCGAGGTGMVLLMVRPEEKRGVVKALSGLINISFSFESTGSTIIFEG